VGVHTAAGTVQKDGTIDNTTIGSVSAINMMRSVTDDNALAAWTFMQWWTSAEIQSAYGNEMVALLGPSAKQNTANIEALANMSWSKDEYDNLLAQFNAVVCFPEFPGSYIISRYVNFAFLDVKNKAAEPIEELRSIIRDINSELSRKRTEFNLPTSEFFKQLATQNAK
jgi:ABC-type glycerol-3-phosphate transport system substrate-binding protein